MLKDFLSPGAHPARASLASLVLRVSFGLMMARYGYMKLVNFAEYAPDFLNFLGLGGPVSLGLVIFAELFCALLVVLGLGTRLAVMPLIVTMLVAFFVAHAGDPFDQKEHSLIFLMAFLAIGLMGAGRYSIDALLFRKS